MCIINEDLKRKVSFFEKTLFSAFSICHLSYPLKTRAHLLPSAERSQSLAVLKLLGREGKKGPAGKFNISHMLYKISHLRPEPNGGLQYLFMCLASAAGVIFPICVERLLLNFPSHNNVAAQRPQKRAGKPHPNL